MKPPKLVKEYCNKPYCKEQAEYFRELVSHDPVDKKHKLDLIDAQIFLEHRS